MDALNTILNEIASAKPSASTSGAPRSRRQPAGGAPRPIRATPAAAPIENASAMTLAGPSSFPRSRRGATARSTSVIATPPATLPAPAGADEADHGAATKEQSPRRRKTRAAHGNVSTHSAVGGAAGQAIFVPKPIGTAPAPTIQNSAGHLRGDTPSPPARASRRSHPAADAQSSHAAAATHPLECQGQVGARELNASEGGDQRARDFGEPQVVASPLIAEITQLWRMRQRWHRAEKSLTLQGKAVCRSWTDGDKAEANKLFDTAAAGGEVDHAVAMTLGPFLKAIGNFEPEREAIEKRLRKLAGALPVWTAWAKDVHGFGELGLAALVGEAASPDAPTIGDYRTVSGLWKRMGLAVIRGKRQRRVSDVDEALEHGYSPARRSVIWNVGGGIVGGMGKGPRPRVGEDVEAREDLSPYRKLFVARIRHEVEHVTETWDGTQHRREPVERKGETFESFSAHAAARAKRYVEKRFLRDLWVAWRAAGRGRARIDTHKPNAPVGGENLDQKAVGAPKPKFMAPSAAARDLDPRGTHTTAVSGSTPSRKQRASIDAKPITETPAAPAGTITRARPIPHPSRPARIPEAVE